MDLSAVTQQVSVIDTLTIPTGLEKTTIVLIRSSNKVCTLIKAEIKQGNKPSS